MRKHVVGLVLLGAMGIRVPQGCGGANSINSSLNSRTVSLVVFGTAAPSCDVFSFQVTITGATLTPANGGAPVPIISSGDPITVDFARLVDFASILKFSNVPVGTYSELTLTLSNPQLTVLDVTQTPPTPVPVASTTLTTSTVTINLRPELTVSTGGAAGLMIDFRLRKSVQTDANGQVTGLVDPIFRAGMTIVSSEEAVGVAEKLHALVGSVTPTSSNPAFTGSFTLQTRGGVGAAGDAVVLWILRTPPAARGQTTRPLPAPPRVAGELHFAPGRGRSRKTGVCCAGPRGLGLRGAAPCVSVLGTSSRRGPAARFS